MARPNDCKYPYTDSLNITTVIRFHTIVAELHRRRVLHMMAYYIVSAWVVLKAVITDAAPVVSRGRDAAIDKSYGYCLRTRKTEKLMRKDTMLGRFEDTDVPDSLRSIIRTRIKLFFRV